MPDPREDRDSSSPRETGGGAGDDAVIARAFRWSVASFLFIVAAVAVTFFVANRTPSTPPARITQLNSPLVPASGSVAIPAMPFKDITAEAGIDFTHVNGAYGDKLLPETMGGGCAFFDYDGDQRPDILLVNSGYWPGKAPAAEPLPTTALYHNEGAGRFKNVTAGSGLDTSFYGMGVATGDFDNDGQVDVFLTGVGGSRLFRNEGGGRFKDVTQSAGVSGSPKDWSTSAAWVDYNNDGRLDLFVCNYVRWSREIDFQVDYRLVGIGRAYGPPMNYPGSSPYLYRNEGGGRFTDVSAQAGIQITNRATGLPMGKSLGVAPVDLDGDGWMDLIVANDTVQNFVFHNERNGTFKEIGATSGIAFDSYGHARGAMGIDAGRFQEDSALGVSIGNFANEMTGFYVSQRDPLLFTDEAIAQGIGPVSRQMLTFGVFFFDGDLDGWLDLLAVNGHIERDISKVQQSQRYEQPAQLYWNTRGKQPGGGFAPVPAERCGPDLVKPIVGRGSAYADVDGDGDLDVLLTQLAGRPLLLRNDQNLGHQWLRLKLMGTKANRDAIGAWVKVRTGSRTISQQVMPTRGYLSQSELPVTIGLGNATRVDDITITWPGGEVQRLTERKPGSLLVVRQD